MKGFDRWLIAFFSPRSESWVGVGVFAAPFEAGPLDFARALRACRFFSPRSFFYPFLLSCAPTVFGSIVDLRCCRSCVYVVLVVIWGRGGRGEEAENGKRRRTDGFLFLLLSYVNYTVYHLVISYYLLASLTPLNLRLHKNFF